MVQYYRVYITEESRWRVDLVGGSFMVSAGLLAVNPGADTYNHVHRFYIPSHLRNTVRTLKLERVVVYQDSGGDLELHGYLYPMPAIQDYNNPERLFGSGVFSGGQYALMESRDVVTDTKVPLTIMGDGIEVPASWILEIEFVAVPALNDYTTVQLFGSFTRWDEWRRNTKRT